MFTIDLWTQYLPWKTICLEVEETIEYQRMVKITFRTTISLHFFTHLYLWFLLFALFLHIFQCIFTCNETPQTVTVRRKVSIMTFVIIARSSLFVRSVFYCLTLLLKSWKVKIQNAVVNLPIIKVYYVFLWNQRIAIHDLGPHVQYLECWMEYDHQNKLLWLSRGFRAGVGLT